MAINNRKQKIKSHKWAPNKTKTKEAKNYHLSPIRGIDNSKKKEKRELKTKKKKKETLTGNLE